MAVVPLTMTVADCVAEWLESKRTAIREPTWMDYREKTARYIIPRLGQVAVLHLSLDQLSRFYDGLNALGLSPRTVRYVHELLHQALQHAVARGYLVMNPSRQVRPSTYQRMPKARLTPGDLHRLLQASTHDEFAALWMLLVTTGMRPSEALGLLWANVDPNRQIIQVDATLRVLAGGRWQRFPFRQQGKRREVPLTPSMNEALGIHREKQEQVRRRASMQWQDHGLMFTNHHGGPAIWAVLVRKHLRPALARAGLPQVSGYSLRHTSVTAMLESGMDLSTVSHRTGYTSLAALVGAQTAKTA